LATTGVPCTSNLHHIDVKIIGEGIIKSKISKV